MKTIFFGAAATAVLRPDPGMKVRVLAVTADVSGATQGEQLQVTYSRFPTIVARALSQPVTADAALLAASVGSGDTQQMIDSQTPATGVEVYNTNTGGICFPLPNIWWDEEVRIGVLGSVSASLTNIQLLYDEAKA